MSLHQDIFKKELKEMYYSKFAEKWRISWEEWNTANFFEMDKYALDEIIKFMRS